MQTKFSKLFNGLLLFCFAILIAQGVAIERQVRSFAERIECPQLFVKPDGAENSTPPFKVFGVDGSNYWSVSTSCVPIFCLGGTNVSGINTQANFSTAASNKTCIFINGILTAVQ